MVDAFGQAANPFAAKLLADVCGFLVTVSRVDPDFRAFAHDIFAPSQPAQPSLPIDAADLSGPQVEGPGHFSSLLRNRLCHS